MPSPEKQDVAKELWSIATSLTAEAQEAAVRKARELSLDVNRGHISLEETLINLSDAREVILDAVKEKKIAQLPLKLQFTLLQQMADASTELTSLSGGKDSIETLESSVEELTGSIWIYRLHELSGQVLGYQTKMNQLKAQETLIRQAAHAAQDLSAVKAEADSLLETIAAGAESAAESKTGLEKLSLASVEITKNIQETQQKANAAAAQVLQNETTTTQHVSASTLLVANITTAEKSAKENASEIEELKAELDALRQRTQEIISTVEESTQSAIDTCNAEFATIKSTSESLSEELTKAVTEASDQLKLDTHHLVEQTTTTVNEVSSELTSRIEELASTTSDRIDADASKHQAELDTQLSATNALVKTAAENLGKAGTEKLKDIQESSDQRAQNEKEAYDVLVGKLDELESRIKASIERATGYSLFHSFQTRQIAIAKEKKFWSYALLAAVIASLLMSAGFIYYLRFVQQYNAAFYLKLSISIPIIYAIAFCNVQYSRERRLEEEYAFKSNISISLDPYQRLVKEVVDKDKPEEVGKYTAFIIDSINKVFTSPTGAIFDDKSTDGNSLERILKPLGDFVEPLVKAIKK